MAGDKIPVNYFAEEFFLEIINEKKLYKVILRLSLILVGHLVVLAAFYFVGPFYLYLIILYGIKDHAFLFVLLILGELICLPETTTGFISLIKDIKLIYNIRRQKTDE